MIEYKEFELNTLSTETMLASLNALGKDDWLLVSPPKGIGHGKALCIMSKRRIGRPPKDEDSTTRKQGG
jgi:hypothetical protein